MRFVLTTEQNYFIDATMNDVIDGTFRVFGKATRVIPGEKEGSINLLAKDCHREVGRCCRQTRHSDGALQGFGVRRRPRDGGRRTNNAGNTHCHFLVKCVEVEGSRLNKMGWWRGPTRRKAGNGIHCLLSSERYSSESMRRFPVEAGIEP